MVTAGGRGSGLVGCCLGEQLQEAGPAAATGDSVAERLAVDEPVKEPVFQVNGGLVRAVGGEPDLDLAGVVGIGVILPLAVDLPGDDQPVGRFPGQDPAPVALAAVHALLVPASAFAWLEDGLGHVGLADVVLGRPPGPEGVGEDAEGPLDGHVDGDRSGERWDGGGAAHRSSCSGSGAAWAALPKAMRASSQMRAT